MRALSRRIMGHTIMTTRHASRQVGWPTPGALEPVRWGAKGKTFMTPGASSLIDAGALLPAAARPNQAERAFGVSDCVWTSSLLRLLIGARKSIGLGLPLHGTLLEPLPGLELVAVSENDRGALDRREVERVATLA